MLTKQTHAGQLQQQSQPQDPGLKTVRVHAFVASRWATTAPAPGCMYQEHEGGPFTTRQLVCLLAQVVSGPDLSVEVNGLKLPNPFVIGSGPPGTNCGWACLLGTCSDTMLQHLIYLVLE
jgi:hypothetical protein